MTQKRFRLHDGVGGSALGVRVIPRAARNEIVEVMGDGTVRIRLNVSPDDAEINQTLARFLSDVLDVPVERIEIVAGQSGRDKLVSITDMDAPTAQRKILEHLS